MLSQPLIVSVCLSIRMQVVPSFHKDYVDMTMKDPKFKDIMEKVKERTDMKFMLQSRLLYKGSELRVSKKVDCVNWMREPHIESRRIL